MCKCLFAHVSTSCIYYTLLYLYKHVQNDKFLASIIQSYGISLTLFWVHVYVCVCVCVYIYIYIYIYIRIYFYPLAHIHVCALLFSQLFALFWLLNRMNPVVRIRHMHKHTCMHACKCTKYNHAFLIIALLQDRVDPVGDIEIITSELRLKVNAAPCILYVCVHLYVCVCVYTGIKQHLLYYTQNINSWEYKHYFPKVSKTVAHSWSDADKGKAYTQVYNMHIILHGRVVIRLRV